jgi:hypothetical protein
LDDLARDRARLLHTIASDMGMSRQDLAEAAAALAAIAADVAAAAALPDPGPDPPAEETEPAFAASVPMAA